MSCVVILEAVVRDLKGFSAPHIFSETFCGSFFVNESLQCDYSFKGWSSRWVELRRGLWSWGLGNVILSRRWLLRFKWRFRGLGWEEVQRFVEKGCSSTLTYFPERIISANNMILIQYIDEYNQKPITQIFMIPSFTFCSKRNVLRQNIFYQTFCRMFWYKRKFEWGRKLPIYQILISTLANIRVVE